MELLKNKGIKIILFSLFVFFLSYNVTFAAWDTTELWALVVSVVQWFLKIASWLIWMLTQLVSLFLYPGWINWELFKLNIYLKQVWILVSNVVYFMFAFILIWIAFMNIIWTKWADKYELKQSLPKFIIWVLIVPISWFFVQFVLSVTSILTIAVLTVPFSTFQWYDFFEDLDTMTKPICVEYTLNLWEVPKDATSDDFFRCENEKWDKWKEVPISELLNWNDSWEDWIKNSIFWIMSIYTYGILSPDWLDQLAKRDLASVDWVWWLFSVWIKVIFDIVFVLMYLILMVALFLALMTRWVYLWVYTMLSPVFWLMFFFDKSSEWFFNTWDKFSIKEFISLALVPVIASAALSFWLLFIFIVWHGMSSEDSPMDGDNKEKISVWWFSLTIKWPHGDSSSVMWEVIWWIQSTIWQIILEMIWLWILWVAVIWSLSTAKVTEAIIKPIADFWRSVWSLVAKSPTYAPILPWWTSAAWLWRMWNLLESKANTIWTWMMPDFAKSFLWTWWSAWDVVKIDERSLNAIQTNKTWVDINTQQALKEAIMAANGDPDNLYRSDRFKEWISSIQIGWKAVLEWHNLDSQKDFALWLDKLSKAFDSIWWPGNTGIWLIDDPKTIWDIQNWRDLKAKMPWWSWTPTPPAWSTNQNITIWWVWNITVNDNWSNRIIQSWWNTGALAESFDWKWTWEILSMLNAATITDKSEIDWSLSNIISTSWVILYWNSVSKEFSKTRKSWYSKVTWITYDESGNKLVVATT